MLKCEECGVETALATHYWRLCNDCHKDEIRKIDNELEKQLELPIIDSETMSLFEEIGAEIGRLVADKQKAYGDSFGRAGGILKILWPNGVPVEAYDKMLTVVRVIDKLFRIATDQDAFGESPWRDVAGYSILEVAKEARRKK